jgi:hypothetical protein
MQLASNHGVHKSRSRQDISKLILIHKSRSRQDISKPVNTHHHGNYGISKVVTYIDPELCYHQFLKT